jgi:hypothetical protein
MATTTTPIVHMTDLNAVVHRVDSNLVVVGTSWNDNCRGVEKNATLSVYGPNITDTQLTPKEGECFPTIRSENYDEMLGPVSLDKVHCGGDYGTLQDVYANLHTLIAYRGFTKCTRPLQAPPKGVMRFQGVCIPVAAGTPRDFVAQNFSYQTSDSKEPRNLILVFTPTGLHVHTDEVGGLKLFGHVVRADGTVDEHWFQAEESEFAAGSAQVETTVQTTDPKRAKVVQLGVEGSDPRCNRMLIVSIPLKQTSGVGHSAAYDDDDDDAMPVYRSLGASDDPVYHSLGVATTHHPSASTIGKCRASRLNVGDCHGTASTKTMELELDPSEPIVCTQIDYMTLSARPGTTAVTLSEGDAELIARDLMKQYGRCDAVCKLSQLPACLRKLTPEHMKRIDDTCKAVKAAVDPFAPNPNALADAVNAPRLD